MRLDLFLPFLRKPKQGSGPARPGLGIRWVRRVLPVSWFANLTTGKPGLIRRTLKRIGPTWLSSPARRVVQSLCFAAFLVLFFYVCWPYSAQPADVTDGWPAHYSTDLARKELLPADPIEDSGFLAPVVLADKCVGCGLCQTRCYGINVADKHLLAEAAVIIAAGSGKEDRLLGGSYQSLRESELKQRQAEQPQQSASGDAEGYLPDFLK